METGSGKEIDWESWEIKDRMKEMVSMGREREDVLDSLTPSLSGWRRIHEGESSKSSWMIAGKATKETAPDLLDSSTRELPEKELDNILQGIEQLGHRMLSMAYFLRKPGVPSICSRMAAELTDATDKLLRNTEDLCLDTDAAENVFDIWRGEGEESEDDDEGEGDDEEMQEEEEEEIPGEISVLAKYLRFSSHYENKLALIEDEDDDDDDGDDDDDDDDDDDEDEDEDRSTLEYLKKLIVDEQKRFGDEYDCWERVWGSKIGGCGGLEDTTTLSPMHFTHFTPGVVPYPAVVAGNTLLIYSIRILEKDLLEKTDKPLKWPLKVYGVVAARPQPQHSLLSIKAKLPKTR